MPLRTVWAERGGGAGLMPVENMHAMRQNACQKAEQMQISACRCGAYLCTQFLWYFTFT